MKLFKPTVPTPTSTRRDWEGYRFSKSEQRGFFPQGTKKGVKVRKVTHCSILMSPVWEMCPLPCHTADTSSISLCSQRPHWVLRMCHFFRYLARGPTCRFHSRRADNLTQGSQLARTKLASELVCLVANPVLFPDSWELPTLPCTGHRLPHLSSKRFGQVLLSFSLPLPRI